MKKIMYKNARILFGINFANIHDSVAEEELLKKTGFVKRSDLYGARLSVEEGKLHITSSTETFFDIPTLDKISEIDYTLQYDVTHLEPQAQAYVSSAAFVDRCTEDCSAYVELPVRAKGRTGHDISIFGCRMALTNAGIYAPNMHGRAEGQPALVQKLMPDGYYDPTQANAPYLLGKKVVVRLHHFADGNQTVYMLIPKEYGGRGEWAIVSRTAPDAAGAPYLKLGVLGKSVKFHINAGANCLIGKICVWEGHDDIDDEHPTLQRVEFKAPDSGQWLLDMLPSYEGGVLSQKLYEDGVGYHHLSSGDTKMQIVSKTTVSEFEKYADKLEGLGFALKPVRKDADMHSYRISRDGFGGYMYHTTARGETRIISESCANMLPEDFSYYYAKSINDTTVMYIYGLHMDPNGLNLKDNDNTASNCGLFIILKLADDSVMIIDGGGHPQMDKEAAEALDKFLHDITKTPIDGRVCIRNWFITHDHGDHFNGFTRFLVNYHQKYELERVMFHFCAIHLPPNIKRLMGECLPKWYPDIKYYKPHTGESVQMADVEIDVLYTPEDQVNAVTANYSSSDGNDNSTCLRIRFDGKSALILGDVYFYGAGLLLLNQSKEGVKSDIVQISHHGLNDLGVLYKYAEADVALYPQSIGGALKANNGHGATVYKNVVKYLRRGEQGICYQGEGTYSCEVKNGSLTTDKKSPAYGGQYGGWDTFDEF